MKRRLLNLLSVLSLLILTGLSVLWLRSYFYEDGLLWAVASPDEVTVWWPSVASDTGALCVTVRAYTPSPGPFSMETRVLLNSLREQSHWYSQPADREDWAGNLRPVFAREERLQPGRILRQGYFRLPYWLLAAPAAVLPTLRLRAARRRRRRTTRGQCPACGYDLRATPGRCPECGETSSIGTAA